MIYFMSAMSVITWLCFQSMLTWMVVVRGVVWLCESTRTRSEWHLGFSSQNTTESTIHWVSVATGLRYFAKKTHTYFSLSLQTRSIFMSGCWWFVQYTCYCKTYWQVYYRWIGNWTYYVIVISLLYFSDRGIIRDGNGPHDSSEHAAWCFCS